MSLPEVPKASIDELRNNFLKEVESKGEDSIHVKDLERVKRDDKLLHRFIAHNKEDLKKAQEMMWQSMNWRKENNVNDLKESDIDSSLLCSGIFFPHGVDVDGHSIFIFKNNKYSKGTYDHASIKKCINYWFERIERQTKGDAISMFFDMDGCGLSNMDLEIIKYFITLFQTYYPFFLNYILIFEMPWVLSAGFKIVKAMLPPEGVQKIKFVSKKDIKTWVPLEEALKSWGGQSEYVFSFVPEEISDNKDNVNEKSTNNNNNNNNNKKVHFNVDSSMSEISAGSNEQKDTDGGWIKVSPSGVITFSREGNELVSTLELHNQDQYVHVSYKLKTTSPEKFRVKPSTGCLAPGETATITVTLLPGFQLGGLSKDKFLVMSTALEASEVNNLDVAELWKNTSGRKVNQHRLKCIQGSGTVLENPKANSTTTLLTTQQDNDIYAKLSNTLNQLANSQTDLHRAIKLTQYYQIATVFLVLLLGIVLAYVLKTNLREISSSSGHNYCRDGNPNI